MGLPLYRPSPSPEPADKAEKTAAQARSSIRRRRSPPVSREDRLQGNGQLREARREPWEITTNVASQEEPESTWSSRRLNLAAISIQNAQRLTTEIYRSSRARRRSRPRAQDEGNDHHLRASIDAVVDGPLIEPERDDDGRENDELGHFDGTLRLLEGNMARLAALRRGPGRFQNQDPTDSSDSGATSRVPSPPQRIRRDDEDREQPQIHSSLLALEARNRPRQAPTRVRTQDTNVLTDSSDSGATSRVPSPQLPANRSRMASPYSSRPSRPPSRPASVLAELPPLSRVSAHPNTSRLARGPSPYLEWRDRRNRRAQSRLDGLGDRERSVSSERDNVWDPLVSTMTPDPQTASASSSFASASAAASISSRSNAGTSSTSMTTIGDSEAAIHPDVCESEHEDQCEETMAENEANMEDEEDDDDPYFRALLQSDYSGSQEAFAVHFASTNEQVDRWQPIILALSRREDIPDEWWAEAGLARILQEEAMV